MAESDFSLVKLISFLGSLVLIIVAFVAIGSGIMMWTEGNAFRGIACILGGMVCVAGAVAVYLNYQRISDKSRYGKK
jgi:hypothetical protein